MGDAIPWHDGDHFRSPRDLLGDGCWFTEGVLPFDGAFVLQVVYWIESA